MENWIHFIQFVTEMSVAVVLFGVFSWRVTDDKAMYLQGPFVHVASITATLLSKFITSVTGIYEVRPILLNICNFIL